MRNNYVALTCKRCGGALNPATMRCPYCGTYHKWDDSNTEKILLEIEHLGVRPYKCGMRVSGELVYMNPEQVSERIINEMTQKLVQAGVRDCIELEHYYDPVEMNYIVNGRLRVLEPSYRF